MILVETLKEEVKNKEVKLTVEELAMILDATPLAGVEKFTALTTIIIGNERKEQGEFVDFIKEMNEATSKAKCNAEEMVETILSILNEDDKEEEEE